MSNRIFPAPPAPGDDHQEGLGVEAYGKEARFALVRASPVFKASLAALAPQEQLEIMGMIKQELDKFFDDPQKLQELANRPALPGMTSSTVLRLTHPSGAFGLDVNVLINSDSKQHEICIEFTNEGFYRPNPEEG